MKIDAHQHYWDLSRGDYDWLTPDLSPIFKNFGPADLEPLLQQAGLDGTIVVQATDTTDETEFLLSLADNDDTILGVVGWVPMDCPDAPKIIERLAQNPKFVGVRPMIQSIDDPAWMLKPSLAPAIATLIQLGLVFDALVLPGHLEYLQEFLDNYPDLPVVIDHCAKPEIHSGTFQPWADHVKSIADNSATYCKLSGLVTEAGSNWTSSDIQPYANHILECFGPDRVMFGSDWPVLNLTSSYLEWFAMVQTSCAKLTADQINSIFGGAAGKFYLQRDITKQHK